MQSYLFTSLIQYFFALFAIQLYYVLCVELLVFVARLVYSRKCVYSNFSYVIKGHPKPLRTGSQTQQMLTHPMQM